MVKIVGDGAEAVISLEKDVIIKERIPKSYRIPEIDNKLRKYRTKREAKVLKRLNKIRFPAPHLVMLDDKGMKIRMEHIQGNKLRDVLEKRDYAELCMEIGEKIAVLHNNSIIHGDLTTSNMILHGQVYIIDFGLSFFSEKEEDKAVDIHLFRQGLESKHHLIWKKGFEAFLKGYKKKSDDAKQVISRLSQVETRGRYKGKKI